ncbi:hypothetical protein TNCV_4856831 [Trichonephila clavipes]|nr:hypothetical protein TNCV_4856831 [Trichonephila clavipes]
MKIHRLRPGLNPYPWAYKINDKPTKPPIRRQGILSGTYSNKPIIINAQLLGGRISMDDDEPLASNAESLEGPSKHLVPELLPEMAVPNAEV